MTGMIKRWAAASCLAGVCLWSLGCGGSAPSGGSTHTAEKPAAEEHGHDHDHGAAGEGAAAESGETGAAPDAQAPPAAGGGSNINFGDL